MVKKWLHLNFWPRNPSGYKITTAINKAVEAGKGSIRSTPELAAIPRIAAWRSHRYARHNVGGQLISNKVCWLV